MLLYQAADVYKRQLFHRVVFDKFDLYNRARSHFGPFGNASRLRNHRAAARGTRDADIDIVRRSHAVYFGQGKPCLLYTSQNSNWQ